MSGAQPTHRLLPAGNGGASIKEIQEAEPHKLRGRCRSSRTATNPWPCIWKDLMQGGIDIYTLQPGGELLKWMYIAKPL